MNKTTLNELLRELNRREFLCEMKSGRAYYSRENQDSLNKIKRAQWLIKKALA